MIEGKKKSTYFSLLFYYLRWWSFLGFCFYCPPQFIHRNVLMRVGNPLFVGGNFPSFDELYVVVRIIKNQALFS